MRIELDKKVKSVITVYLIVILLYVIAFLLVPFNKVAASWITFVFTIIAFIVSLLVCGYAFKAKEILVSKIYGFPIFRVGAVYALSQLFVSIIICIIGAFTTIPYWVALLFSVILLGAAVIGVIVTDNARDMIEEIDESVNVDTSNAAYFQINIDSIVDACENPEIKTELEKLSELFEFSDPVTNDDTKEIENGIKAMLVDLKSIIVEGNTEDIKTLLKMITNALNERNRICKATKGG